MGRIAIYPYKQGSHSAKALADAIGCRVLRHQNSKFVPRRGDLVINWGSGKLPSNLNNIAILNPPKATTVAGNKLSFFKSVSKDLTVPWSCDRLEAQGWLDKGSTVVARTSLTGHSGHGIVIVEPGESLPNAPLYTKYIVKESEYRIHVFDGKVIFSQRKVRDPDREPTTWKVRSHDNGFIFQHSASDGSGRPITVPEAVQRVALQVMAATELHFGAVDVVYSRKQDKGWVLEVNTAPGLEGTTVEKYAQAIKELKHL